MLLESIYVKVVIHDIFMLVIRLRRFTGAAAKGVFEIPHSLCETNYLDI